MEQKELWKSLRANNIGGSDIAALFGHCPYSTYYKLWHEKRGNIEPDNIDDVDRVAAGNFLEAGIIDWANHKFGFDFIQPHVYVEHSYVGGMGCTPDAYSKSDPDLMAQIKNVDSLQFSREWENEGEVITKAPLHILLQVQHEMDCSGRDQSILIVCVGGNRLFYMVCNRDGEVCSIIRTKVMEFWARDEAPDPDYQQDYETIRKIRSSLPVVKFEDYSEDEYFYDLLGKYSETKTDYHKLEDKLETMKAEILDLSIGYENIKCKNILVKYKKTEGKPDKIITESDLGKTIKGRKASETMKIIFEM